MLDHPSTLNAAKLPDPKTIPPRLWLYGNRLLPGYVSALAEPGGVGETDSAMAVGLAVASGRPLFGEKIYQRVNVAILNCEDPMDELNRRLAALMLHHDISREEIDGKIFLHSSDDRPFTIVSKGEGPYQVGQPDEAAIIHAIQQSGIGLLVIDPYVRSDNLEENSHPQMTMAAAAWQRIARATACSILLVHYLGNGVSIYDDMADGAAVSTQRPAPMWLDCPLSV